MSISESGGRDELFVLTPSDGKFTCLWCGERGSSLGGHMCERKKRCIDQGLSFYVEPMPGGVLSVVGGDGEKVGAWSATEAWIRATYRDPTPKQLEDMPGLKTVDERVENARKYHDWHLEEHGYAPRIGGMLGVR